MYTEVSPTKKKREKVRPLFWARITLGNCNACMYTRTNETKRNVFLVGFAPPIHSLVPWVAAKVPPECLPLHPGLFVCFEFCRFDIW